MNTTTDTKALPADVATVDEFDAVVDSTGNLWVRRNRMWRYVTEDGLDAFDQRTDLPECYEPYLPLDAVSAKFVMRGVK